LFSPHEIGKSEELRELELPGVGNRFGETFGFSEIHRKCDYICISDGFARRGKRRDLFWGQ
jgi:hypothetical protein